MPSKNQQFQGTWIKTSVSPGNDIYPDRIVFKKNGLYFGNKERPDTFTCWDVGTYEVVSENQVRLSTATDALITYQFTMSGDNLRFVDPQGRELDYRRVVE